MYRSLIEASRADVESTPSHAVAAAGADLAAKIGAKVIIGFTAGGTTAARISRSRPPVPILALTPGRESGSAHVLVVGGGAVPCLAVLLVMRR
ncbi:pyruvate kinase alpha/beta domain-containing protein [Bradyrhizobium sp. 521_C7_N1_3]|nr:pyruvate kinase alpha/beta domain-containing protein [Bradyrhizobium japonicum]